MTAAAQTKEHEEKTCRDKVGEKVEHGNELYEYCNLPY